MKEKTKVKLIANLPEYGLKAGTVGIVVLIYSKALVEVEIGEKRYCVYTADLKPITSRHLTDG